MRELDILRIERNLDRQIQLQLGGKEPFDFGPNLKAIHREPAKDEPDEWADVSRVAGGDPCPRCGAPLRESRGIEVGHIFDLGTKYSAAMDATFLDESGRPSLVMGRGMYTRTTFSAWTFDGTELSLAFVSDSPSDGPYAGKGAHGISVANVDDDPMQEIIGGSATFDHDGTPLCAVPFYGHGDALHVSDLVPSRPGLEVFMPFEGGGVVVSVTQ